MMKRFFKVALLIPTLIPLLIYCVPPVLSQTLFGTRSSTTSEPQAVAGQPNPVISPNDFGKLVTTYDRQTKTRLGSEYAQQVSRQPVMPAKSPTNEINPPASTSISNQPITDEPTSTPTPQASPAQPVELPKAPPPDQPLPPPPPKQPEVYTGFGPGAQQPNNPPANSNQPASGGWNIKY